PTMVVLTALLACAAAGPVRADDRKFTYSYEAKTLPQGTWEFEQWATLQTGKDGGSWNTWLFREEIEYGITDRLNASIYLNTEYQANSDVPGFDDEHHFGFQSMSTEWKYKLSDPAADPVGVLLYGELGLSSDEVEFEAKLVLSKELGRFTFAYNFVYEAELEEAPDERPVFRWEHIVSNTFGVSYALVDRFSIGAEALDIFRNEPVEGIRTHAYYAGPNVHYSSGSWWATLTVLRQVSFGHGPEYSDGDNTKWQVRLIFGINF
ncbi:MAG: hypothetical protein JO332_11045, partial [Planctomycetaceae bacterium]|nr:hypothetical protein [Planctomycetaceae bacterium]